MLKSVLAEFRRTGLEEASFSGVSLHCPLSRSNEIFYVGNFAWSVNI